jgi:hypothetical protein
MKTFYLLLFLFTSCITTYSQEWAPAGAKWFHSISLGTGINGYIETKVISDTVVSGKACKRIGHVLRTIQMPGNIIINYNRPDFYTYEDSGKVFVSDVGPFYLNQDWRALPGDTVPFLWAFMDVIPSGCDPVGYMIINSVDTVAINGINYRREFVNYYDSFESLLPKFDIIIEHFGATYDKFFFNRYACDSTTIVEVYEFVGLTCYYEPALGWIYFNSAYACDYLSTNEELIPENISVFPNPATDLVEIYLRENTAIRGLELIDITGNVIRIENNLEAKASLDVSKYSTGIYFLKVHSDKGSFTTKLLIE